MKHLILISLFLVLSTGKVKAVIHDAFMCNTGFDTVVLFGIVKPQGTLSINYHRLDLNPTIIDLKVSRYERSDNSIEATGFYQGKQVVSISSKYGSGTADIDLSPFPGTEDVSFTNDDIKCYFGKFEE